MIKVPVTDTSSSVLSKGKIFSRNTEGVRKGSLNKDEIMNPAAFFTQLVDQN